MGVIWGFGGTAFFFCFRLLRRKKAKKPRRATATTPPTIPPTMAPVLLDLLPVEDFEGVGLEAETVAAGRGIGAFVEEVELVPCS